MLDNFLLLPKDIQSKIITSVAYKLNLSPAIIEKDFWVCFILEHLFSIQQSASMVFKGGTSLSKCYKLINRFSEDLDITIDYRSLKEFALPIENYSKSFLKNASGELKKLVKEYVCNVILPSFEQLIQKIPDKLIKIELSENGEKFRVYYSSVFEQQNYYLANSILVEFGGRNITEPNEIHTIRPYLFEYVENLTLPVATVNVLSSARTFWEKITLIHVECHRGRLQSHPDRLFRHWYDLAMLAESSMVLQALSNASLMLDVIKHKKAFFDASYANYDKCLNKQFQLIPRVAEDISALKQDFNAMLDAKMFYSEEPSFNKIIDVLRNLEQMLNK